MRQAILITAYKNLDFITQIIDYFDQDFEIFIHIDKKCRESYQPLMKYSNVHISQKYRIEWGGENHLKAILFLLRESTNIPDIEYFHLITGSDYPIKNLALFKTFFKNHKNEKFLEYFNLPRKSWGPEGGLERIKYFWLRPNTTRLKGAKLVHLLLRIQKRLGVARPFNFFNGIVIGGGTYWSISRKAVDYLLDYIETHPSYLRRFHWTSIAEEICFPTIWANSCLPFINNSLRYIDWGEDGSNPQVLTEKDIDKILISDAFFARKIDPKISESLISILQNKNQ